MDSSLPSDVFAPKYPISIKGVVEVNGRIVLLRNERDEWELPGGKLEGKESPTECVEREVLEELGIQAKADVLLDVWMYDVLGKVDVFIVTYAMRPIEQPVDVRVSHEHKEVGLFSYGDISALNMPAGYKRSITTFAGVYRRLK